MGRSSDIARVCKGAGKVAQAFVDGEGPRLAAKVLRFRDHGAGLTCSLRDAVSSAANSAPRPDVSSSFTRRDELRQAPESSSNVMGVDQRSSRETEGSAPTGNTVDTAKLQTHDAKSEPTQNVAADGRRSLAPAVSNTKQVSSTVDKVDEDGVIADNEPQWRTSAKDEEDLRSASTSTSSPVQLEVPVSKEGDNFRPWASGATDADSAGEGTRNVPPLEDLSGVDKRQGMSNARARTVPSSPLARVFGFGQLAAGLAMGTVAEAVRQSVSGGEQSRVDGQENGEKRSGNVKKYVVSDANAERLAETLCRMRGAALKLGQMLSIQDESIIPPSLAKALDRVRQGADMMPPHQLHMQLENSLGADWRNKLSSFDETPLAAASIGQVHRARLLDGTEVAMKIQYPGVADSVESDLKNLQLLVKMTNILPPGLYIDEIIKVGREELGEECNYEQEASNQERFRRHVESDPHLNKWASVPRVVHELSTKEVLTTHFASGVPVDQILPMAQEVRNHVARLMLRCTVNELFDWRFMQTDPNWGNFLFDKTTGRMSLIDFGACREYRKDFVDDYFRLVWSAANRDEDEILRVSQELKFLTGDETPAMMQAHVKAGLVVGEPFLDRGGDAFDFHGSNITARLSQHGETFMKHRLTPPPQEAYSLHRKLAGAFLMNIKLRAIVPCRDILEEVHERYTFG